MEVKFNNQFNSVSYVWSMLKRHVPETIVNSIRGMRMFKDQKGVVFDVPDDGIQKFEDIFNHLKTENRIDYHVGRAKDLPDLREDGDFAPAQGGGGYGGRGGYGGGYGQQQNSGYGNRQGGGGYGNNRYDQSNSR